MHLMMEAHALPGSRIGEACAEACALARKLDMTVALDFGGCWVVATTSTEPGDLARRYERLVDEAAKAGKADAN